MRKDPLYFIAIVLPEALCLLKLVEGKWLVQDKFLFG